MHRDQDQERHINSVQTSQMFYRLEAHLLKWILHLDFEEKTLWWKLSKLPLVYQERDNEKFIN